MVDQIRWGVLGTASIAKRRVVPAIQQARNGRVMAVASRSEEKARAFADELNLPKAYGSYEALLGDPDIDAIYIPLPNSEHASWGMRCAEAGKPVLCEKPLAGNAAEAEQMVAAFGARGLLLAEGFMYRFHPQTERVKELVMSGAVGALKVLQASFTFTIRGENNIRLASGLAGGSLMDVGCYCVNLMRLMTDEEPDQVAAVARYMENDVDEFMSCSLLFPSGVIGHFDCGMRAFRTPSYEVRGTTGRIVVEQAFPMEPNYHGVIRYWHEDQYEEIILPPANHFTLMAEDFADALLNGRPPRYAPEDAIRNLRVLDSLSASARANRKSS